MLCISWSADQELVMKLEDGREIVIRGSFDKFGGFRYGINADKTINIFRRTIPSIEVQNRDRYIQKELRRNAQANMDR